MCIPYSERVCLCHLDMAETINNVLNFPLYRDIQSLYITPFLPVFPSRPDEFYISLLLTNETTFKVVNFTPWKVCSTKKQRVKAFY